MSFQPAIFVWSREQSLGHNAEYIDKPSSGTFVCTCVKPGKQGLIFYLFLFALPIGSGLRMISLTRLTRKLIWYPHYILRPLLKSQLKFGTSSNTP